MPGITIARREFLALLGMLAAGPLPLRAEPAVRRIGILMNGAATEEVPRSYLKTFVRALRQLGWIEGQNLRIDVRWNAGDAAVARLHAAQLVGQQPDAILAASTTNLMVMQQATSTIPVVFLQVSDPVEQGFVKSMTHPGGNLTGFTAYDFSVGGKWLDLLKETAPALVRVGVMFNPDTSPQSRFFMRAIEAAAPKLGVKAVAMPIRAVAEIEPAITAFARQPNGGLVFPTDSFLRLQQSQVAELTFRHRIPALSTVREFAKEGGLITYGATINIVDHYRRAAGYIDRILKGAKVGDLPVHRADKFTLVINLKTAKAFGLTIPLPLLGLADEILE
jgi:putative tryptophan/tyrosine transport system substrate-binding protein